MVMALLKGATFRKVVFSVTKFAKKYFSYCHRILKILQLESWSWKFFTFRDHFGHFFISLSSPVITSTQLPAGYFCPLLWLTKIFDTINFLLFFSVEIFHITFCLHYHIFNNFIFFQTRQNVRTDLCCVH
jgi:hypothetical protein